MYHSYSILKFQSMYNLYQLYNVILILYVHILGQVSEFNLVYHFVIIVIGSVGMANAGHD